MRSSRPAFFAIEKIAIITNRPRNAKSGNSVLSSDELGSVAKILNIEMKAPICLTQYPLLPD
jgi:hypothetical protein